MIAQKKRERGISLFLLSAFFLLMNSTLSLGIERIISVSPAVTDSLVYLGYGDKIIGKTDYCIYFEEEKKIESIGNMFNPNLEKIVYMKPDYVIFQSHFNERLVSQLEKMGIPVLKNSSPKNIAEIFLTLEKMIRIFDDDNQKKESLIKLDNLRKKLEESRKLGRSLDRKPKIFYFLGMGHHIYTAGKETFIDDIITSAGGINIVEERGWSYPLEALIVDDPDLIIASRYNWERMKNDSRFERLSAVRNNKVILIEDRVITLPTPKTLTEGLDTIQKAILNFNFEK